MNPQIEHALKASIHEYSLANNQKSDIFSRRILEAFKIDKPYLEKVEYLDRVFDDFIHFDDLREIFFDLLLINFFAVDVEKLEADYLESPEWERIEDQTIDRGTELLNVLLYLRECKDEKISPELNDFLKEFSLVEEDEFQDEYRIYEPFIENQILVDSDYDGIAAVAGKIDPEHEVADLFYPVMCFFSEPEPTAQQFDSYVKSSRNKSFDAAVLALIVAYNQS